jgi:DNA polymerase elongation subunit (family B)
MSDSLNRLIYGKGDTSHIVSIEPLDDQTLLFLETPEGIIQKAVPNRYWMLANRPYSPLKWRKMAGNQHFQYGVQFASREEFESNRNQARRFGEDAIYSVWDKKESYMINFGETYYRGMELRDVSILSFDIETTGLNPFADDAKVLLISNTYRKGDKTVKKLFAFDEYHSQTAMLNAWSDWVREMDPSILCGHNIISFDLFYMNAIARSEDGYLNLGRDNSPLEFAKYESKFRKDQTQFLSYKKPKVFGREVIDTYFLAIRKDVVEKRYDSYGLKQIIKVEGLENETRIFYDASQIRNKYKISEEWNKIKQYCTDDSDDALKLFDRFSPAFFYMAQTIPKSFQEIICGASGSQINSMLVRSYLQDGYSIPKPSEVVDFQGAVSFAVPGIYRNMLKIDFSGLYPSILRQFQLYDKQKDPNKHLTLLIEHFATSRLKHKKLAKETGKQYYEDMQQMEKILCNSFYGFLATRGLNYNSPDIASFVTAKAREFLGISIEWATGQNTEQWLSKFKNEDIEVEEP